jgi:hypothetical protein
MWKAVDRCEYRVIVIKKINFIAQAGNSGTPLIKKPGIKPEIKLSVLDES